jgi:uncharacterized glyoxalase superfamily protein PhnB
MAVSPIPDQYHTVTPYLIVNDAAGFIDFAKEVMGAQEMFVMPGDTGKVGHAELKIGDSVVMLSDGNDMNPVQPATLVTYFEDCVAVYRKALAAGASSEREPQDMFWGDRTAGVKKNGVTIWFHTHIEDVPPEEMEKRAAEAMQNASG